MDQVRADLRAPWTLERMAAAGAMSPRTLLRRFTEATGQSPGDWLIAERVAEAQRLLEATSLPVERIAAEAGFSAACRRCATTSRPGWGWRRGRIGAVLGWGGRRLALRLRRASTKLPFEVAKAEDALPPFPRVFPVL
ncbi:MAG: helix-turn-helix domain-containing protein [Burkholderiales bacterium]|nr:helix-turn-helix domain-containing protein [Burkholderiales bacterium]